MTNITLQIENSKQKLTAGNAALSRSYLELFYKGFHSFEKMTLGENFIVFKVPTPERVKSAVEDAQKRIAEKGLPLVVVAADIKYRSNTFIVKINLN